MAHKVALSWDVPPAGQTQTGWTIRRAPQGSTNFAVIGTSTTNSFVDDGSVAPLVEGATYQWEVAADNGASESGESNIAVAAIPFTVPAAPTSLKAVVS